MFERFSEPPPIYWKKDSIVVFNLNEEPINAFAFYENKEDSYSMVMCGDLEDFEDQSKEQMVTFDMLYEMYELSRLIKENVIDTESKYQKQITDFIKTQINHE
jgi:hypothetical protein